MVFNYPYLLVISLILFYLPNFIHGDWGLKDMGKSYMDQRVKEETEILDSSNYVPLEYNELCSGTGKDEYTTCKLNNKDPKKLSILILDQLPVMATQLGCGKRMFHILEALIGLGYRVSMAYLRPDMHETPTDKALMERLKVPILHSPLLVHDVKEAYKKVLKESKPDIIVMTLWYWQTDKPWFNAPGLFTTFTKRVLPNTKLIIMTDDVHWLRMEKLSTSRKNSGITHISNSALSPEAEIAAVRLSEYQNYAAVDAVVTISHTDRKNILRYDVNGLISNRRKLHVVPFVASPWETQEDMDIPDFINRRGLVFVGNLMNPTNIEGLRWFLQNVMPMIVSRIPGVTITIIGGGRWPIQEVKPTEKYIRFLGWLPWEHMRQELNAARVFVSPIVVSTGVNTKNSLAMSNGVPLITTAIGAAGLCDRCDDNPMPIDDALDTSGSGGLHLSVDADCPFIVAADHEEFVRGVMELYSDEIIWNTFSRRGIQNTHSYLSVQNEAKSIEKVLSFVTKSSNSSSK